MPQRLQEKLGENDPPEMVKFRKDLEAELEKVPGKAVWDGVNYGVAALFPVLLLAGGVGLLNLKPWGRAVSVVYAVLSLATKVLGLVFFFAFFMPVFRPLLEVIRHQNVQAARIIELFTYAGAVFGVLVTMTYPLAVLIVMLLPSTAAAFHRRPPVSWEEEPFERRRPRAEDRSAPDERWDGSS
jgi:hypothetical protein